MDLMAILKAEKAKKRKEISDVEVEVGGKKFFKRGDLSAKQEKEYLERLSQKKRDNDTTTNNSEESSPDANAGAKPSTSTESTTGSAEYKTSLADVKKKLRRRNQPIILFGEQEHDIRARLLKHEIEQPDLNEGWKNDMVSAMQDVDRELVKEVIEGSSGDTAKHDVALPDSFQDNWEKIEHQATLLGLGDDIARDCEIILTFLKYLLARWAKMLNQRDHEVKKSPQGLYDATIQKQTATDLKPLMRSLETRTVNNDIRHHLCKICRILILDRNYVVANNAYMEMSIGNAPWPVGVTRSGIHQRPGSAKSYVSNIAHVLNNETQRKYIQGIKRLMTKMQEYFPTDPSKCVEYVK